MDLINRVVLAFKAGMLEQRGPLWSSDPLFESFEEESIRTTEETWTLEVMLSLTYLPRGAKWEKTYLWGSS